jgi:hypothetical protein
MDNEAVVILSDADNVQTSSSVTARARVTGGVGTRDGGGRRPSDPRSVVCARRRLRGARVPQFIRERALFFGGHVLVRLT